MVTALLLTIVALSVISLILLLIRTGAASKPDGALASRLELLEKGQERLERILKEEASISREEVGSAAKMQRQELAELVKSFGDAVGQRIIDLTETQKAQLDSVSSQLGTFAQASGDRLDKVRLESAAGAKQLREEVVGTLKGISETITRTMGELATSQKGQLDGFSTQLGAFAKASGERLDAVRVEAGTTAKQLREEVVSTLNSISETMAKTIKDLGAAEKVQLESFAAQLETLTKSSGDKLDGIRIESSTGGKLLREEVGSALKALSESVLATMDELAKSQQTHLEALSSAMAKLSESNEKRLEAIRVTVESRLQALQADNAKQLDQMRQTVDEKLQGTLEKRLGESFKQVSERLEQVHKGLGEMQVLATGVGDLKKMLTNVKTRGTWGEVQLGALLEQVLTREQYAVNVSTKDSAERVEYAIKLPGPGSGDETVWLPIDAKFPVEDYQRLIEAQERSDLEGVEVCGKLLEARVRSCAKHISDKYLNPPVTTDFGVLFLPIEGLFAEIIRRPGLQEVIQRKHRVVIAGPTTLWSILNSLQMGFRTLAIEKRSSEVWSLLAAVKTEWGRYGDVLDLVQKKLHQASETVDKVQVRSRAVGRKLRDVQELPAGETASVLSLDLAPDDVEALPGQTPGEA
jgi:DNA recombination protein RmuC